MRQPSINTLAILLCCLAASPAYSDNQIYQWLVNGKTFFSDKSHPNARVIILPEKKTTYRVKRVIDGDTLLLDDGTKVRLLGINTPEIQHGQQTDEAGGRLAKQWLTTQLTGQAVRLETDNEKLDRYGRTLAHVFTSSNDHINVQLVQQGLAVVSLYPPNVNYAATLIAAQTIAETKHIGLWNDPAYAVKSIKQLNLANQKGWQRLTGIVQRVRQTRQYYYLGFSGDFSVRIHRSNAAFFPDLKTYIGHTVEVRGLLNQQQNALSMLIRHPDAIRL